MLKLVSNCSHHLIQIFVFIKNDLSYLISTIIINVTTY